MDHRKEFEELFSLYTLGLLEGNDLKKVEEHLRTGCEECRDIFKETEAALSLLPYSLVNSPLSPELRNKVWERIEQVSNPSEMMEFIQSPNVVVISFTAPQPTSKAHGKLFWNKENNQALFCALDTSASHEGKTYQLWVVEGDTVLSMGIFKVDGSGTKMMRLTSMPEPDRVKKFIVTIEPEGGMFEPSGEVYLTGLL